MRREADAPSRPSPLVAESRPRQLTPSATARKPPPASGQWVTASAAEPGGPVRARPSRTLASLAPASASAVFAGLSFESPGEAEAFEDALLRQACVNGSFLSGGREACVSRLDTARGGAGSGPVPVLRAALRDTLGEAVGAVSAVRGLASLSNHPREEMAVRDCVELLGYSVDELGWALDAMADTDGGVEMDASGRGAPRPFHLLATFRREQKWCTSIWPHYTLFLSLIALKMSLPCSIYYKMLQECTRA